MLRLTCLVLLGGGAPLSAQQPPVSCLSATAAVAWHSASAQGTSDRSEIRAAPGVALGIGIVTRLRGWELHAGGELFSTRMQVRDSALSIEARTPGLSRMRVGVIASRAVARLGGAKLLAGGGGAVDTWSPPNEGIRIRIAAAARLALRVEAGRLALENSLGGSLSPSFLEARDLPDGYRPTSFQTISAALTLLFGLGPQAAARAPHASQ